MVQFKITPHIADIRLKVQADSIEHLFATSLQGMNSILHKDYKMGLNRHSFAREIFLNSYDLTSLLIDFLSEVLTLTCIDKAIFHTVSDIEIHENNIHVHLLGSKVDHFDKDIKAVTYHEAEIKRTGRNYETTIVFDI